MPSSATKYGQGLGPFPRNNPDVWLSEFRAGTYWDLGSYPLDAAIRLLGRLNPQTRMQVWDQLPSEQGEHLEGEAEELIPVLRERMDSVARPK